MHRRARIRRRGFTLVELMVALGMVAILSTIALVGYRRYINSAQSNEARGIIGMLRGGEEAYKAEFLIYLQPNQSLFSLGSYYPNPTPNDTKYAWNTGDARYSDPTSGWALLNVQPDTAVRFGYAIQTGVGGVMTTMNMLTNPAAPVMPPLSAGVPWYVIQAVNDHNANGVYAVFAACSTSGEIFSQAEYE